MRRALLVLAKAPAGEVYRDDFNRADSTTLGSPWVEDDGSWEIRSNALGRQSNTPGTYQVRYGTGITAEDHYAQVKVIRSAGITRAPRLLCRYVDADNYWIAGFEVELSEWQVWRRVSGTTTKVATATYTSGQFASGDTLRVESVGDLVRVLHNGVERVTFSSSTGKGTDRQTGIRSYMDSTFNFDDWECGAI